MKNCRTGKMFSIISKKDFKILRKYFAFHRNLIEDIKETQFTSFFSDQEKQNNMFEVRGLIPGFMRYDQPNLIKQIRQLSIDKVMMLQRIVFSELQSHLRGHQKASFVQLRSPKSLQSKPKRFTYEELKMMQLNDKIELQRLQRKFNWGPVENFYGQESDMKRSFVSFLHSPKQIQRTQNSACAENLF